MSPATLYQTTADGSGELRPLAESEAVTVQEISIPEELFGRYVKVALRQARPRQLTSSGDWYADLPSFPGVWASGGSPSECLDELDSVLREWLILKLFDKDRDIPVVDEIDLTRLM